MSNADIGLLEIAADAAVQRAMAATVVPIIRHGVLVEPNAYGQSIHSVQIDGDDDVTACHDVTTGFGLRVGFRVTVMFTPPHQAMIIGCVTPLGPIRQLVLETNTGILSVSTLTDMVINDVPAIGGRTYAVHLHTLVEFAAFAAAARWNLYLRVNTVQHERVADLHFDNAGTSHTIIDGWAYWTPDTTDFYDLDIFATEVTDGGSIQLQANATNVSRSLTVHDVGILPAL